jgi:hypothetical protein
MVRRLAAALFAAATVLGIVATPGFAVTKQASNSKGPIGWDVYRRLDELPALTSGVATKQFSSFDRTGGNGDFSHCLTTTSDGKCVIAQHSGAGEVDSIWFTRDGGDTTNTGNITIQLDGKTVLHAPLVDVVNGKLGAPFVFPLVANADQSSGGDTILVPMPFRSSMKIITDTDPVYYHVTYRTFADASGVNTFDPSDNALDVVAKLKAAGTQDPKPAAPNAKTQTHDVDLANGKSATIGSEHRPGAISQVKLHLPQLSVIPPRRVTDDGHAFGANGYDEFTVAINPDNQGVRLTRRFDPGVGNQRAGVSVDGTAVAEWKPEPALSGGQWADESVDLPASATAGKSTITIRDTFESSDNDFNGFTYWIDSLVGGQPARTDTVDIGPNHTADEAAHHYQIVGQTWAGSQTYVYPPGDNAAVKASDAILSGTRIQVSVDGRPTVDAPIGQFFGSGLGGYQVNALMTSVDPTSKDLTAWWPMPYGAVATVQLVNESGVAIKGATASITAAANSQWAGRLAPGGGYGYFRATSDSADTTPGTDYEFLQAQGQGKFVGVSHTMTGVTYRGYLEGDERVYVDGANTPQIHGTGTEDFYEGGWYFNRDVFSDPLNGESGHEEPGTGGCPADKDCTSTYREMIGDSVPFKTGITFGIEHGGVDDEQAHYASTAFWYGNSGDTLRWTDTVAQSGTSLTSTFEGNDGAPAPVADSVNSTTSPVSFPIKVDPANHGVVLRRISDQQNAYQQAEVTVNGHDAGSWLELLGNTSHRWLDDDYQLPASLTAGHSTLDITITPASGAPAWTAASYAALSVVAPFGDHTAPGVVSGLTATGDTTNSITLSWTPATDNVYAPGYQIYGSTSATGPFRKIADTSQAAFTHVGLALKQTWHYRVRAVDAAGNTGPWSATASATSGNVERVEAESLLPPVDADAPVQSQGNCCNVQWSGGAQLWFQPTSAGKHVTVAFDVPTAGTYDVTAVQTKARDYGINTIAIDGTLAGTTVDAYNNPDVVVTQPIDYGTHQLSAGRHTLTLTVTGKNADSIGYLAGIDYLDLTLNS